MDARRATRQRKPATSTETSSQRASTTPCAALDTREPARRGQAANKREQRERVLRRDDFYDPDEPIACSNTPLRAFEEAFWLCGAHAGLRLPGEALGLRWGAVDFNALVLRPYDNWVLGELDTTEDLRLRGDPYDPSPARALLKLKQRGYATER